MSRIRGSDTKPEIALRTHLWEMGLRYRLRYELPGRPDLVFVKQRVAVFVDGCFWHGCPDHATIPSTNRRFWEQKIGKNLARDDKINKELDSMGWLVIRIWEHEIKHNIDAATSKIMCVIDGESR